MMPLDNYVKKTWGLVYPTPIYMYGNHLEQPNAKKCTGLDVLPGLLRNKLIVYICGWLVIINGRLG